MLRFVKTLFCSIHFTLLTVTFCRAKRLFVLPKSSLNRGSLNRGFHCAKSAKTLPLS